MVIPCTRTRIESNILKKLKKKVLRKGAKNEIALKMLKRGRPIEEIIEDTGLSAEEIRPLLP